MSDFLVLGAGIAGASVGYFLSEFGRVTLLEMEAMPGYHSTGRSAALFSDYYGNAVVRALTAASRSFLLDPPAGFSRPLMRPRGTLALCRHGAEAQYDAMLTEELSVPVSFRELTSAEVMAYCPIVRSSWFSRAMLKPSAMDIDVNALHQGFLRGLKSRSGNIVRSARVTSLAERNGWRVVTNAGEFRARSLVNATGAWADQIAELAGVPKIGLTPMRRTAAIVSAPGKLDVSRWPLVTDVEDAFYFKPEAGQLLLSPADATPFVPCDVRPDAVDVALAIDRVQAATTMVIKSVRRTWAGLRSAVPDDTPVVGESPGTAGFFWAAALSGYGIQTAPAIGRLAAALVTGQAPSFLDEYPCFDLGALAPQRSYYPDARRLP
jgi:D-arginine dehydrogenase